MNFDDYLKKSITGICSDGLSMESIITHTVVSLSSLKQYSDELIDHIVQTRDKNDIGLLLEICTHVRIMSSKLHCLSRNFRQ